MALAVAPTVAAAAAPAVPPRLRDGPDEELREPLLLLDAEDPSEALLRLPCSAGAGPLAFEEAAALAAAFPRTPPPPPAVGAGDGAEGCSVPPAPAVADCTPPPAAVAGACATGVNGSNPHSTTDHLSVEPSGSWCVTKDALSLRILPPTPAAASYSRGEAVAADAGGAEAPSCFPAGTGTAAGAQARLWTRRTPGASTVPRTAS